MANFTYDETQLGNSPLFQARLHAADTDTSGGQDTAIFCDEELSFFLAQTGDPMLAAAMGLETVATDKARLAVISSKGSGNTDTSRLSAAYAERAATLRALAPIAPAVASPDQVFSTGAMGGDSPGTMDLW